MLVYGPSCQRGPCHSDDTMDGTSVDATTDQGASTDQEAARDELLARMSARLVQLETLVEAAPVGIGVVDALGRAPLTNNTLRQLLGYTSEEFATIPFSEFTHPDDVAENDRLYSQMMAGDLDRFAMEKRFLRKDGSTMWADLTVSLVRDATGAPDYAIGMTQDITERKRLEHELREAEVHYRMLVERVPAVVYIAEPGADGRWLYVSPQVERMLGFTPEEWLDDPTLWSRQLHAADRARVREHEEQVASAGVERRFLSSTYRIRHRSGHVVWVRDDAMALKDPSGRLAFHGVMVDVTQEKALEERLGHLAEHDPLTGLVNREQFRRRLAQALERRLDADRDITVLFVDLDDFKTVNDTFGHAAGDRVLAVVASRLQETVGDDGLAARLGGDEFGLVVAGSAEATVVAERVLQAVRTTTVDISGYSVRVGASIGIAVATGASSVEELLQHADRAMYEAKLRGGGSFVVDRHREQAWRDDR